ncbi:12598_t:CDS:2 [Funneliformis caledonium]|uniref:12598_t:CDS:1 n=1 Tax=Funneliformis caledonium TaxID=1117310 RepID=A0A9N8VBD7_9GLOM|nr:12598_t:CDS:2 [Funneliformis caledonium]
MLDTQGYLYYYFEYCKLDRNFRKQHSIKDQFVERSKFGPSWKGLVILSDKRYTIALNLKRHSKMCNHT